MKTESKQQSILSSPRDVKKPSGRLRLGIIGCGGITAFAHVPALCVRDDIDIAYLCDVNLNRADVVKRRFSLDKTRCVCNFNEILNDESVEAIIVASQPSNHAEIALRVIQSDRHALIQKPLTLAARSAEQLVNKVAKSTKSILALPLIDAISSFVALRKLISDEKLGTITFARIRTTVPGPDDYYADVREFFHESSKAEPPYRKDGYAMRAGSIADMGPYALSTFYYLFGPGTLRFAHSIPAAFDCCTLLVLDIDKDINKGRPDAVGAPFCCIETGWKQIRGREICTVFGSKATACIESTGKLILLQQDEGEQVIHAVEVNRLPLPLAPLDAQNRWIDAIRSGGKAIFRETLESAVWVSKIIDDARKVARQRRANE